jgi:hypothetical protein
MEEKILTEREQEEALEKVARVMILLAQSSKQEATDTKNQVEI